MGREIEAGDALFVELESLYDGPIRRVPVHSVEEWLAAGSVDLDDVLVVSHESRWNDEDWRALDKQRSRLMRRGLTIVIVDCEKPGRASRESLVFPDGHEPKFVRFDLNEPGHDNQERDIRSHLHPGHDDLLLPAVMSPEELLDVLIRRVRSTRDPETPRS